MKKLILLISIVLILSGCTAKSDTCDLVDSKGNRAERFRNYMSKLDTDSHFELTNWLVEQENSVKGIRLGQTRECAEFIESESITINGKTYTSLYKRTSDLTFEMGFRVDGNEYWYTRN